MELHNFCDNVDRLMKDNGLKEYDMAEIMGVSRKSIIRLLNHDIPKSIGTQHLLRISKYFRIRICELFFETK